jgi:uncharacterized protein YlxW (UPF0749 family)
MAIQDSLIQLRNKLQLLLKQYSHSQKIILSLKNENVTLQAQMAKKQEEIDRLQARVAAMNMSVIGQDDESKKEMEKRINTYLKEIDKCLSLLNN